MTLFSTLFGAKAQQNDTVKILIASEFKKAIANKETQLVDVRTAQEFKRGAIKNALNIDFFEQSTFNKKFSKLNKEQPVYLYCRSGNRSHKAAVKLEAMGFTKIYDLKRGYISWSYKN